MSASIEADEAERTCPVTELGSMAELEGKKGRLEGETERELEEADENREEVAEVCEVLDDGPPPSLEDTVHDLNQILDGLDGHIEEETERHREQVVERVGTEKSDLSEPVRDGQEVEHDAAAEIEGRAARAGRYGGEAHDVAARRTEAEELLAELGDESEEHQEHSRDEVERLSQEARAAADALRRY